MIWREIVIVAPHGIATSVSVCRHVHTTTVCLTGVLAKRRARIPVCGKFGVAHGMLHAALPHTFRSPAFPLDLIASVRCRS